MSCVRPHESMSHLSLACKISLGLDANAQLKPNMSAAVGVLTTAIDAAPRDLILRALAQALHLKFANAFSVCQDSDVSIHFPWKWIFCWPDRFHPNTQELEPRAWLCRSPACEHRSQGHLLSPHFDSQGKEELALPHSYMLVHS